MRVLWIGKTGDANAWYHIYPFVESRYTSAITVVRTSRPARRIDSSKLVYDLFGQGSLPREVLGYFRTGARVLARGEHDIVVAFGLVPWGFFAWIMARVFRKPIIVGLIGTDFHGGVRAGLFAPLFRYALRSADLITVPGSTMREEVIRLIGRPEETFVFPHCLPTQWLEAGRSQTVPKFRLITVSALTANKRTIDILEAVRQLVERGHDVSLAVIGDGAQIQSLKSFVLDHDLVDRVHFHGHVPEVGGYLDTANVFVQASLQEGLSLSLVEALGRGVIPVTTRAGSEGDVVEHDVNGLFVGQRDPIDIAEKVEYALRPENFQRLMDGVSDTKQRLHADLAIRAVEAMQRAVSKQRLIPLTVWTG